MMDFTIPRGSPPSVEEQLLRLIAEFQDGYLTEKGYIKKRQEIIDLASTTNQVTASTSGSVVSATSSSTTSAPKLPLTKTTSTISTSTSTSTPNPSEGAADFDYVLKSGSYLPEDNSESLVFSQPFNYDEDYYYGAEKTHNGKPLSETSKDLQKPLDPRNVEEVTESAFENLPSILRHRGSTYKKETAILLVDQKGKESQSISWEKLYLRAEKIAQKIKNKAALYPGDRVCLIYQNIEVIDFMVALYGCFLSGTVAVPMNSGLPVKDLVRMMTDTQSHLCLMSDSVYKHFEKQTHSSKTSLWPKGMDVWRTTDMGLFQSTSKQLDPPAMKISDLAYIEYSKSSIGELRGVVISHRTIMHQMKSLVSILTSMPDYDPKTFVRSDIKFSRSRNVLLSTLDARESIGLIYSALFTVFTGNMLIWTSQRSTEVAGLFANMISKYRVSVILSDYLSLKQVAYNYQAFPQMTRTFNKKIKVDLSCVKWCLINTVIVDCEFNDMLSDRWFKPLGHKTPRRVIAPILSLNEHGGAIVSMRDWVGNEENLGCIFHKPLTDDLPSDAFDDNDDNERLSEVLIDKASLATNTVKVVSDRPPPGSTFSDHGESSKYIRAGAFGYPLPDATLAIVNPETRILSGTMEVGEIWVDSHCISGGFWGLAEATQTVFQAECSDYEGILNLRFVRTGLLGFTYNGKVYVLGMYEDRISQRVTWFDRYSQQKKGEKNEAAVALNKREYRYHYSSHLVKTLARNISEVSDCSFFNIRIHKDYVPVVIIESPSAVATNATSNAHTGQRIDRNLLDDIASRAIKILEKTQNVRLYCVLITAPDVLPRTPRSGRLEIANMLCRRRFMEGKIASVYVKFNFESSLSSISKGDDVLGGVWSQYSSEMRSEALSYAELQYSGLDLRETCVDDRTNLKLTDFATVLELLKLRATKQPDEMAYASIDRTSIKETRPLSWKKFEARVFAVCAYILEKKNLLPGDHVVLMYSLSEEVIIALYACWLAGFVVIMLPPIDPTRLDEDANCLVSVVNDYKVKAIFVNNEVETMLKNKPLSPKLKAISAQQKMVMPKYRNTSKHTKSMLSAKTMYSKMAQFCARKKVVSQECLIWISWTSDHKNSGAKMTHSNLLAMCKNLKETCQISSLRPLLGCVRHCSGLGFLQAMVLGVYLGTTTYLYSPVDYAIAPASLYMSLDKYKIENAFVTERMLEHAIESSEPKKCDLSNLKNLMVGWEDRPSSLLVKRFLKHLQMTDLSTLSVSNVYHHIYNPMISLRSYLSFAPVELWLDPLALSQGYVSLVSPHDSPNSIHLQDSGIVPVNTQLAIVNPETLEICRVGEFGEIWVCSESTVSDYCKTSHSDEFDRMRFRSKIKNWNQDLNYLRTGDFGFLHNVSKTQSNGTMVDLQLLYVLGKVEETFEVMGMQFFVRDIEAAVERLFALPATSGGGKFKSGAGSTLGASRTSIIKSCVFKAGDYVILVVETARSSSNLSSLVPLIVNQVLNYFGLVIDIVSFVGVDNLPMSRLGDVQRGKVLRSWLKGELKLLESFGVNYGESMMMRVVQASEATSE